MKQIDKMLQMPYDKEMEELERKALELEKQLVQIGS